MLNSLDDIKLKRVKINDKEKIAELIHFTISEDYKRFYPDEVAGYLIDYHNQERIVSNITSGYFIAVETDHKIIAAGCLTNDEINSVYTHPEYQNKGLGKIIMQELMQEAEKKRLNRVYIDAMINSRNFYEKLGFKVLHAECEIIRDNIPLDYYRMVIEINE